MHIAYGKLSSILAHRYYLLKSSMNVDRILDPCAIIKQMILTNRNLCHAVTALIISLRIVANTVIFP